MKTRFQITISADEAGTSAIDWLATDTSLSRTELKTAMTNGAVWHESEHGISRLRRAKRQLKAGDKLHLYYDREIQAQVPEPAELIDDRGEYSIWRKPYGMYSQGTKWGDHCTIYRWAEQHLDPQRSAFLVHRLDRAASGLIIIAHKRKTASAFAAMFSHRQIEKYYFARVEGDLSRLQLPCKIDTPLEGKPAESVIVATAHDAESKSSDVLIEIKTGRKHQIRRHLAAIGTPIIGDRLHGAADISINLQLQSVYLGFKCPLSGEAQRYMLDTVPFDLESIVGLRE